jgi:hypothetical protein
MASRLEGGCLCGAVRYAVRGEPAVVALCHCNTCRRAAGAPAVAWAMFRQDAFEMLRGERATYESSKGAARGFCGRCGTQLTWEGDVLPGMIDTTLASFDDPAALAPQIHIWEKQRLPWLQISDTLPRHAEFPPGPPPA